VREKWVKNGIGYSFLLSSSPLSVPFQSQVRTGNGLNVEGVLLLFLLLLLLLLLLLPPPPPPPLPPLPPAAAVDAF